MKTKKTSALILAKDHQWTQVVLVLQLKLTYFPYLSMLASVKGLKSLKSSWSPILLPLHTKTVLTDQCNE